MKVVMAFIKPSDAPQANQLTGFCMIATLANDGLKRTKLEKKTLSNFNGTYEYH